MADESTRISAGDARLLIAGGNGRPLDLRPHEEISDSHIPGAIATDPDDLEGAVERATREGAEITLVVVGDADHRSDEIAGRLREMGHEAVALEGGFGAWLRQGARTDPPTPEYEGPTLNLPGGSGTRPEAGELEVEEDEDRDDRSAPETRGSGPAAQAGW